MHAISKLKSSLQMRSMYTGVNLFNQSERRILVTGGTGQIGMELVPYLRKIYGKNSVINSDIKIATKKDRDDGPFVYCDVLNQDNLARVILENGVDTIIHLASLLSAIGEKNPQLALKVNTRGVENVLELAKVNNLRVFSPSTIAVFGPTTPKQCTPDLTIMRPTTIYGITKVNLELLGEYYNAKFGVDFRSIRFPGIISSLAWPGGGTTDYAVEIFYKAILEGKYTCFLRPDTTLPMMYMPDCLKSIISLMDASDKNLSQRTYNVTAFSFSPSQLAESIRKIIPKFEIFYKPDFRQDIADTWPNSLDDTKARKDWSWEEEYQLDSMSAHMIESLEKKLCSIPKKKD